MTPQGDGTPSEAAVPPSVRLRVVLEGAVAALKVARTSFALMAAGEQPMSVAQAARLFTMASEQLQALEAVVAALDTQARREVR